MNSRPVRVLQLRDSPWVDGPGRTLLETGSRLDPRRVDYHLGVFVSGGATEHPLIVAARERGIKVIAIPDSGGIGRRVVDPVSALLREHRIDILHTSEVRSNLLGLRCRSRVPVRLVSTVHGWITNDLRSRLLVMADRVLLRLFDHVIVVSHATRRRIPRVLVPDSMITVLHNAIVTDSYGVELARCVRVAPDPSGPVRLLNVGRLSPEKGQDLLLDAVARLGVDFPRLGLTFAGIGPLEDALRQQAQRLGIADRVSFLGFVKDMPAVYAVHDLVVQSSETEGLPNVILEAAALGMPVVATDVGGTAEVINHGKTGWLIRPRSVEALVGGIRHYLADPARFVAMARSGQARIAEEFTYEARTEAQTRIYESLP